MSDKTVIANVMCNPSREYLGAVSASVAGLSAVVVSTSVAPRVHFTRALAVLGAAETGLVSSTVDTIASPKQAHSAPTGAATVKPAAFDAVRQADRWAIRSPRDEMPER